ncbi:unnamed protein product, partial [Staurois parvus]
TGATDWQHCWAALLGTGGCTAGWHRWAHCWVAQVGGASGRTAGHRWAELVGAVLGTGGRNLWVALLGTIIRALISSALNCRFSAVL